MSIYDIFQPLVALAADKPTQDDITFDEYLWHSLYEYGQGDIPLPADVAEITDLAASSPEGYGSVNLALIARLRDDRWATCVAWADTTGFGCQEQVDWRIHDTRDAAIAFGLDQEGRNWLGLDLPGSPA